MIKEISQVVLKCIITIIFVSGSFSISATNNCGISSVSCTYNTTYALSGNGNAFNTNTNYPAPFGNWYESVKQQYLYGADKLVAGSMTAGNINSISFYIISIPQDAATEYRNYTISLKCTDSIRLSYSQFETNLSTVFTPKTVNITTGWNELILDSSYYWDGISNLIVEICFNNNLGADSIDYTENAISRYSISSNFPASITKADDDTSVCAFTSYDFSSTRLPDIKFGFCSENQVYGFIFNDRDLNCLRHTDEEGISNRPLTIMPGNITVQTDSHGLWVVDSLPTGTYTITFDTTGALFYICPVSRLFAVTHTDSVVIAPPFGFTSNPDTIKVWPGDANNDLIADNFDLLVVGYRYNTIGRSRSDTSNIWMGQTSLDWNDTIFNGVNMKHADCNGDGIINDADTLAINLNYGLTHVRTGNMQSRAGEPLMTLVPDKAVYLPGDTVVIDMVLGNANNPVANLYGIAFNITFDNSVAETGTVQLTYPNSFLGNTSDNLTLSKIFEQNGKADGAVTRKSRQNAGGYGTIATLQFIAKNNTSLPQNSSANVSGYFAITSIADSVIFDTQFGTASFAVDVVTGITNAQNQFNLTAYPNPFTHSTTIQYTLTQTANTTLKVNDVLGRLLMQTQSANQPQGTHQIQFENNANGKGIYIIELTVNGNNTIKRILQVE